MKFCKFTSNVTDYIVVPFTEYAFKDYTLVEPWNNTFNEDQNKRHDEELTSMLQRYLDHPDLNDFHQKSPGQQSSDSGFSGEPKSLPQLDFEDNPEDLSQLVDQVLSSIETQFPEYLNYVDQIR